jgi:hypothetical protein
LVNVVKSRYLDWMTSMKLGATLCLFRSVEFEGKYPGRIVL